jgi:hypothetical protein
VSQDSVRTLSTHHYVLSELVFRVLSFSFVVYGSMKIEFQFCCLWIDVSQGVVCLIVLDLEVPGSLRGFTSTFLVVLPYLFLCIYHFPRRHMMSDFIYSFISYRIHYSFYRDIFYPRSSPFCMQLQINTPCSHIGFPGRTKSWKHCLLTHRRDL